MSLIFFLIGAIMLSISIGHLHGSVYGWITLGGSLVFVAILDEIGDIIKEVSNNKNSP